MKKIKLVSLLIFSLLAFLSLTACGGNNKKQSLETEDRGKSEKVEKNHDKTDKPDDSDSNNHDSKMDQKKSNRSKTSQQTNQSKNLEKSKTQQPQKNRTNQNSTQTQQQEANTTSPNINTVSSPEDAVSLFAYSNHLGDTGTSGYTANKVKCGYVITPKEPAWGHSQTIVKDNGDIYDTDGRLIEKFKDASAPNDPSHPTWGWHDI